LAIGQDLSERAVQLRPPAPQFSLGKSFPGFGPVGPWITTPDELSTRDDLSVDDLPITARLNGDVVQHSHTSDLIFPVAAIIEYVSHITPMLPGDVVFTGTPAGVGMGRVPLRHLRPGDVLESTIEGLGTIIVRPTSDSFDRQAGARAVLASLVTWVWLEVMIASRRGVAMRPRRR
jgi:2-keto-4-pentenoate hydratase/2-oxohepta-3-ene-1,7-dioic acid hydratase in catechol pathway